jgi:hypothetical protein
MGMTIDQIIKYLNAPICADTFIGKEKQKEYDAHDSAVIILRKYQKIQEIVRWNDAPSPYYKPDGQLFREICEVLKDE